MASPSILTKNGYKSVIADTIAQVQELYRSDQIPWVVGYSGGKDSTAILQLTWQALIAMPADERTKPVHVISTDTLVENPVVALWVERSLTQMKMAAESQNLPIYPHRLTPEVHDRFWVNVIGKGYPAPRPLFRWCTSRLKINPSNKFINDVVRQNGEAILVLGTRKAESSTRSANMADKEQGKIYVRDIRDDDGKLVERQQARYNTRQHHNLSTNQQLDRVWVYTPIAEWSNSDVWMYLNQDRNPWQHSNDALMGMYRGATDDNECPLVVDTSTPSCGDSRFGCYVCTLVGEDKSLSAMIRNDAENEWMLPLLELRTKYLDITDRNKEQRHEKIELEKLRRDFRRMTGGIKTYQVAGEHDLVHGPYLQSYRLELLRAVLKAQQIVREIGPPEVKSLELLSLEDLEEIRRIWVMDKHEIEDLLPAVYAEVVGKPYPALLPNSRQPLSSEDLNLLRQICIEDDPKHIHAGKDGANDTQQDNVHFEVVRSLIHVEMQHQTLAKRANLFKELEKALKRGAFSSYEEALAHARQYIPDQSNAENFNLEEDEFIRERVQSANDAVGAV